MRARKFGGTDRRRTSVAEALAAEPVGIEGLNQGLFYPPTVPPVGGPALAPTRAARSRPTKGQMRCLVVLVDFNDNAGNRPAEEFREMLFSRGQFSTGSMRDFYEENSRGHLDLDGQVVGWLRMPETYAYYTAGKSGTSLGDYPRNAQKMAEDAVRLAAEAVNFKDFDGDEDDYLDGLFLIHAGEGAETDEDEKARGDKIWSHQWNLTAPFKSRGVSVYAYCTEPEDGRVGVFCHEFGHMLGLPDLYDTTNRSHGVGAWCVMGAGSWNNDGLTPAHFCAWAKARLGWLRPKAVREAGSLTLGPVEAPHGGDVYRLWTGGGAGKEHFLLENRQLIGFDRKLPGTGLLIWHIDETRDANDNPGAYLVALEQADGLFQLERNKNRGDAGDPFPGSEGNNRFDDTSAPHSRDNLGNSTGVAVKKIKAEGTSVECEVAA
jgi:immune inhibitor A